MSDIPVDTPLGKTVETIEKSAELGYMRASAQQTILALCAALRQATNELDKSCAEIEQLRNAEEPKGGS